jgi:hypothetical protein
MATRSSRITKCSGAAPPACGSPSTSRLDHRLRRRPPRSRRGRRRQAAPGRRPGEDRTPQLTTRAAPGLAAQRPTSRDHQALRRRPRQSSRTCPPAAAARPEPPWPLRPRSRAAAGGVFPATRPVQTPSRALRPVSPGRRQLRGFRVAYALPASPGRSSGQPRPQFRPAPAAVPASPGRSAGERRCPTGRRWAHPPDGASGWLTAAPTVSRICCPYLASLLSPTPLTVPSSARLAGSSAAIWRSVASWKIT